MKRPQQAPVSPADIALTRTAAEYAQTRQQRMRERVKLLRVRQAKR